MPAILSWGDHQLEVEALVDSGAEENFIDVNLVSQWNLPTVCLEKPLVANALTVLKLANINHSTALVSLSLSGNHHEQLTFHVIRAPQAPVVLGHPWLVKHNPHIDWAAKCIMGWSPFCHSNCLLQAQLQLNSAPEVQEDFPDLSGIPLDYMDLKQVFSKSKASSLPPHRPYDCAIDLLPSTSPPRGRLYSLSRPETESHE